MTDRRTIGAALLHEGVKLVTAGLVVGTGGNLSGRLPDGDAFIITPSGYSLAELTPDDLVDFAYGFSITEGIIERADQIRSVEIETLDDGLGLRVSLIGERLHKHLARQRAMTGRTGCGVCGIDDIEALRRAQGAPTAAPSIAVTTIARALRDLDDRQVLNIETRAVHGAAWADGYGTILAVREDVGRHNALDKLIGNALREDRVPLSDYGVVLSGRASFELMQKAKVAGCSFVAAVGAPSSLAVELAREFGMTLVGFLKPTRFNIYNRPDRIVSPES